MDERPRRPSGVLSPFFTRVTCILFPVGGFVLGASGPRGSIRCLTPRVPATPQFIQRTLPCSACSIFSFCSGDGFRSPALSPGRPCALRRDWPDQQDLGSIAFPVENACCERRCGWCNRGNLLFNVRFPLRKSLPKPTSHPQGPDRGERPVTDPKHQVRKQAIVQERSTMNASVMRMNANAAATRSVACALPARRTAQRGKTQPKQHEQSNSLVLCRLRTRTLGDTRRETREGAGTGGDDRGVDMPMMAWDHDERARERAPDSRERREGARSTAPVVRPSRNAAPTPTPPHPGDPRQSKRVCVRVSDPPRAFLLSSFFVSFPRPRMRPN